MSTCSVCAPAQSEFRSRSRWSLSPRAATILAVIAAMTFSASGAAPTPLYHHYQESFGLTALTLTIVFAAYVLSLLAALLTVGALSDFIGRRPAIVTALLMNIAAMAMFMNADSAATLIAARAVQGFATGLATATLGATVLDHDRQRGSIWNSITAFGGLTAGSLGAALVVTYGPDPDRLVYALLLMLSLLEMLVLGFLPETVRAKAGAWASLRPQIRVPSAARAMLLRVTPLTIASWALGGFYFSLMPALVLVATGVTSALAGGSVVAALTFSGALSVLALRPVAAPRLLAGGIAALVAGVALTLAGSHVQQVWLMLLGTVIAGVGFGAAFSGTMLSLMPLAEAPERAGLLAAFYVEGYLAFSLPAMLTGALVPAVGLIRAADGYGIAVIAMALVSLPALLRARKTRSA